jgi:hypothetical protein
VGQPADLVWALCRARSGFSIRVVHGTERSDVASAGHRARFAICVRGGPHSGLGTGPVGSQSGFGVGAVRTANS